MTKLSITCSSSVKFAYTGRVDEVLDVERNHAELLEIAPPQLHDLADDVAQVDQCRRA